MPPSTRPLKLSGESDNMPFAPLSGESDNLPFAPLRPQAMQPLPRPCKQRKMASFTQPRLARCGRMLQPAADRGRAAAAVAADGGRSDGKGCDAAHGCQRCRQRLRLHVEINPNRVDSALSLSQCCLVSCRVPAGTRRVGPGRLPCATTLGRTLRDRPSRPAYRKL